MFSLSSESNSRYLIQEVVYNSRKPILGFHLKKQIMFGFYYLNQWFY